MKTYCVTTPPIHAQEIEPLQRALKTAGFYRGPVDGIFGAGTGDGCHLAKWAFGFPKKDCTHCGGQNLLNLLTGTKGLPPAYIVRRHARGYGKTQQQKQREAIVRFAHWGHNNAAAIHYAQVRPMDHLNRIEALPWTTDCSEFVTTIYKWAGAPDPNGRGYDGLGYTGTMLDHGVSIPLFQCLAADVVIWGGFPGHHTAVLVEDGKSGDPLIVSHGSESGPSLIRLSQETAAQGGRWTTFKRYIS